MFFARPELLTKEEKEQFLENFKRIVDEPFCLYPRILTIHPDHVKLINDFVDNENKKKIASINSL